MDASRPKRFLTDQPIRNEDADRFDHKHVAQQLADIVTTIEPPAAVALIGGFGSGKSSVANLLGPAVDKYAAHDKLQV